MGLLFYGDDVLHHLTVRELKELLTEVPDDFQLVPNKVGNLAIYPAAAEEREICLCFDCILGAVDLGDESVSWYKSQDGSELCEEPEGVGADG